MAVLAAGLVVLATLALFTFQRGWVRGWACVGGGGGRAASSLVTTIPTIHRPIAAHTSPITFTTNTPQYQAPQAEAAARARGAGSGEVHPLQGPLYRE